LIPLRGSGVIESVFQLRGPSLISVQCFSTNTGTLHWRHYRTNALAPDIVARHSRFHRIEGGFLCAPISQLSGLMPGTLQVIVAEALLLEILLCLALYFSENRTISLAQAFLEKFVLLLSPNIILLRVCLCGLCFCKLSLSADPIGKRLCEGDRGSLLPRLRMNLGIGD